MSNGSRTDPQSRAARERAFHDSRYASNSREGLDSCYSLLTAGADAYEATVRRHCAGCRVLEYGCGEGKFAVSLASLGATVDAIDISGVALETASRNAAAQHAMIGFRLMNAEDLEYEDDTFDLICGRSILHHLDLEQALSEISRTLKADGKAIFLEPLGHNPILNVARRVTPQLRSADEHPLLSVDIESARRHFESVEARYFHLSSLLAIPFRRAPGVRALVRALEAFDKILVATFLRKYAWVVVLTLARPKKSIAHRRPSR